MNLLNKHLLRTTSGPFVFGFCVVTFVLMIDILYRYVELFVTRGVSFWTATEVLILSLGHMFALSIPMAVLIGVLMGVGQLAADHEITAMKASGIGLYALLRPLLGGALVLTLAMTAYNHYVLPEWNHKLANLLYDIKHVRPMMEIREQLFTELNDRITIYVKRKDEKTNRIEQVIILEKDGPGDIAPTMTTAAWGTIVPLHDSNTMRIELHDGEIHDLPDDNDLARYTITRFNSHNLHIKDMERNLQASNRTSRGDREMNLTALLEAAGREAEERRKTESRSRELSGSLAQRQWSLLDPRTRGELLGRQRSTEAPDLAQRRNLLKGTRQEARRAARSAGFQENVVRSQRARENSYMVEFHKKFAIPVACLVFVLLGLPMAVSTARSGRGVSLSLALGLYLVYYLFLIGGEKLADRGRLDPALAMWMANASLTLIGIPVLLRTVKESSLFSFTLRPRADGSGTGETD
ncbi:LptF/LptG family permease [bacterium]|nr:LptF/LptG family permease [bacterium]MBU1071624.1 LptF/LptG family permease [bacterium]MBU1676352.1 LptF/LptG family permease [bacterium]